MKQIIFYLSTLFIILLSAASCSKDRHWIKGEGDDVSNLRSSISYTGVSLSISAEVELIKDSAFRIELIGQQNVLDVIETEVKGSTLCIGLERFTTLRKHNPIKIKLHQPSIQSMEISGSGNLKCLSLFQTSSLDIRVSGSGSAFYTGDVTDKITANVSGSGDINLDQSSNCKQGNYTISGSGNINADWVKVDDLNCDISGSGSQRVYAIKTMNVKISGSGKVYYRGNPVINSNISGSGKVQSLQ